MTLGWQRGQRQECFRQVTIPQPVPPSPPATGPFFSCTHIKKKERVLPLWVLLYVRQEIIVRRPCGDAELSGTIGHQLNRLSRHGIQNHHARIG